MAHFAELDDNNIVINVIAVNNEDCLDSNGNESEQVGIQFLKNIFGSNKKWVQTSYNTVANKHKHISRLPLRGNYAGIGYKYDESRDGFIPPNIHPSFILNEETLTWECPVPYPEDGNYYVWNEFEVNWVLGEKQ